ncbi:hypothetical protein [Thalassotalea crassostreae]|nr:hypothetical protein [Thalassotalea crassostreae]
MKNSNSARISELADKIIAGTINSFEEEEFTYLYHQLRECEQDSSAKASN